MNVQNIEHARIKPNAEQPRKHFDPDKLDELAESIREAGLLQPITVRSTGDTYQIVAGERRWRACALAGLAYVPAIVREMDDREAFIIATMENVARQDMNPIEEANALQRLLDLGMTAEAIEGRIGMARNIVTWKASLTKCTDLLQHLVSRGQFPVPLAISASRLSANGQQTALREYQAKRLNQLEFTQLVNAIYAQEHNLEMFAETRVSRATAAGADRFRRSLAKLSEATAAISDTSITEIEPALHDLGAILARIDEAAKVLQRAKSQLQRAKGRSQASLLLASG